MKYASLFLCFEVCLHLIKTFAVTLYAQTCRSKRGETVSPSWVCASVRLEMRIIIACDCVLEALDVTSLQIHSSYPIVWDSLWSSQAVNQQLKERTVCLPVSGFECNWIVIGVFVIIDQSFTRSLLQTDNATNISTCNSDKKKKKFTFILLKKQKSLRRFSNSIIIW